MGVFTFDEVTSRRLAAAEERVTLGPLKKALAEAERRAVEVPSGKRPSGLGDRYPTLAVLLRSQAGGRASG